MKNTPKIIALLASAILITACSGGGGGGNSSTGSTSNSGNQATTPATPTTPGSGTTTPPPSTTPSTPTVAHTLQLSWTIPTTRENGNALTLTELSGYQIYYYPEGSAQGAGEIVNVSGGSTNSTQVTINGAGTYYFAIAAVDQVGLQSNLSNYVAVTLN